jgi:hypothetical protein
MVDEGVSYMAEKNHEEPEKTGKKRFRLSVLILIIIFITFAAGLVAGFFINNLLNSKQISISLPILATFVVIAALSAVSIILAIMIIWLIRNAENSIIQKDEEGIMLQKEIIDYSNKVLRKVRSLGGMIEKGIEDLIVEQKAGLKQEPVQKPLPEPAPVITKEENDKAKEEEAEPPKPEPVVTEAPAEKKKKEKVKPPKPESLPLFPKPPKPEPRWQEIEEMMGKGPVIEEDWKKFRSSLINMLTRKAKVKLIQKTEGNVDAEDQTFWNAIFKIGDRRFGLDVHTKGQIWTGKGLLQWLSSSDARNNFARKLGWRALQDGIDMVFVIFDEEVWSEPGIIEVVELIEDFNARSKASKIIRLSGKSSDIVKQIMSIVSGRLTN